MINEKIKIYEKALLTTYIHIPNNNEKRPVLIICPGGGYIDTSTHEGECVALTFLQQGYQCFVLDYSTLNRNPGHSKYPQPLLELSQAIQIIKSNHEKWYIDFNKIFLLGFSAGGNLIANYGNYWKELSSQLNIDSQILKPTALVLCYPALNWKMEMDNLKNYKKNIDMSQVTGENKLLDAGQILLSNANKALFNNENPTDEQIRSVSPCFHINSETPPSFLWHTVNDNMVSVQQIYEYVQILGENNIPYELHVFQSGDHGLSLANQLSATKPKNINMAVHQWVNLALTWLKKF